MASTSQHVVDVAAAAAPSSGQLNKKKRQPLFQQVSSSGGRFFKKMCAAKSSSSNVVTLPNSQTESSPPGGGSSCVQVVKEDGPEEWKELLEPLFTAPSVDEIWQQVMVVSDSLAKAWIRSSIHWNPTSFNERIKTDRLSCSRCGGVLHQVVTLVCGHSVCRKCSSSESCFKCGRIRPEELPKTNVTVMNLVTKWWNEELRAVDLRAAGNAAFADGRLEEALQKYSEAAESDPDDFTAFSNRSNVYSKLGRFEEALKDAEKVVQLRPDWPKSHYRRAVALRGLGKHEDALVALLQCAGAERSLLSDIREDVAREISSVVKSLIIMKKKSLKPAEVNSGYNSCESSEDSGSEEVLQAGLNSTTSESEDGGALRHSPEQMMALSLKPREHLSGPLVGRLVDHLELLKKKDAAHIKSRAVDAAKIDEADFECSLCCRLLWQPVSTPCGHSFCRTCLDRCMDHNPACPLCKTSLEEYLAERRQSLTEFLDHAMATYLPAEYAERSRLHDDEMRELASANNIPIFVCTMAYPSVACPLHVFEPRYRLMIRRCMESGARQFGMCTYVQDQPGGFAEYGTMLEVRDVEFFADGRSVVDTIGGRRFKVLRRGMLDGYATANVEFLTDQPVEIGDRTRNLTTLHDRVRELAKSWVEQTAPAQLRQRIQQNYGSMPALEPDWITLPNGPAWLWWLMSILPLDPKAQVTILSMTKLEKRLEAILRVVEHVRNRTTR